MPICDYLRTVCLVLFLILSVTSTGHAGPVAELAASSDTPADNCKWECKLGELSGRYLWIPSACPEGMECVRMSESLPPIGYCTGPEEEAAYGSCMPTMQTYWRECEKVGVPTPPNLSSSAWKSHGRINTFVGVGPTPTTGLLYSWQGPKDGVCLALQRDKQTGIICTNAEGEHACFYNLVDQNPLTVDLSFYQTPMTRKKTENCVTCHQGYSPFLRSKDLSAALKELTLPSPQALYSAVGAPASWENTTWGGPTCGSCHNMPRPNPKWCQTVGLPAISTGYMPRTPATKEQLEDAVTVTALCCYVVEKAGLKLPEICIRASVLPAE